LSPAGVGYVWLLLTYISALVLPLIDFPSSRGTARETHPSWYRQP
jgi:hypothetical protein